MPTVKSGDNLSKMARQMGVSLGALMAANPGINVHLIRPGQKINKPSKKKLSAKDNARQMSRMVGQAGFRTKEELDKGVSLSQAFAKEGVLAPTDFAERISGVPGFGGPSEAEKAQLGYDPALRGRGAGVTRYEAPPVTEGSLSRYLVGGGGAQPQLDVPSRAFERPPVRAVSAKDALDQVTRSGRDARYGFTPTTTPTTDAFARTGREARFGYTPTAAPSASAIPGARTPAEVEAVGRRTTMGDAALNLRVQSSLRYHAEQGSPITEEEALDRVLLAEEGYHPTLRDNEGAPVRMVEAVFDPHSQVYSDSEAEDWLRRVSHKQAWTSYIDPVTGRKVQYREPFTIREDELEVSARNITRVMELANIESGGDPDAIRFDMPDVASFEGMAYAASLLGMDVFEFLAQWEYAPLDPEGLVWQKKEQGTGLREYAFDAPSPRSASRGRSRSSSGVSSAPYGSASKLAFDWRVRIT